jgi:hypothetical protein
MRAFVALGTALTAGLAPSALALPLPQGITMQTATDEGLLCRSGAEATSSLVLDLSADGRYTLFLSGADNLVPEDTNGFIDLFLRDRLTGEVERVSLGQGGVQGNHHCGTEGAALSSDMRFVVFTSFATNLAPGASATAWMKIFVRDRLLGTTDLVSFNVAGQPPNSSCLRPAISDDGRIVAFSSPATNVHPGDTTSKMDVFLRDRLLGTTELVSTTPAGTSGDDVSDYPSLSADGRYVCFNSQAQDIVVPHSGFGWSVYVRDRLLGITEQIDVSTVGVQGGACQMGGSHITDDGRWVVFASQSQLLVPEKTTLFQDVFVRDRQAGTTARVSVGSGGVEGNFHSYSSMYRSITPDGRWVAFTSWATNLNPSDPTTELDVYVHDRQTTTTILASQSGWNAPVAFSCWEPILSHDGRFVAFTSNSYDITFPEPLACIPAGYCELTQKGFVRDLQFSGPAMSTYCTPKTNSKGCKPQVGANGGAFTTGDDAFFVTAIDVVPGVSGLFVWSSAPATLPFAGGTLCVQPPLVRTTGQVSQGSGDCFGSFSFHFSQAYMAQNALAAGQTLFGQYWMRDGGFAPPNNVALTQGIQFTLLP